MTFRTPGYDAVMGRIRLGADDIGDWWLTVAKVRYVWDGHRFPDFVPGLVLMRTDEITEDHDLAEVELWEMMCEGLVAPEDTEKVARVLRRYLNLFPSTESEA